MDSDTYIKIYESICYLKDNEHEDEPYTVGFSGGKDSIVTLQLCRMAGVRYEAQYACTTIDPPEVARFIRKYYKEVKWNIPKKSFFALLMEKRFVPTRFARWCCRELKETIAGKYTVVDVRAEESARRAKRPRTDLVNKNKMLFKPIFYWTEQNVWDFIDSLGLPYPSLYDTGNSRLGCIVCPMTFGNPKAVNHSMEQYPHVWARFKEICMNVYCLNRLDGMYVKHFDNFQHWWLLYIYGQRYGNQLYNEVKNNGRS